MQSMTQKHLRLRPSARLASAITGITLLALSQSTSFGADLVIGWINVDSDGNLVSLQHQSGELNAATAIGAVGYIGGLWSAVKTPFYDQQSGTGVVLRYVNMANEQWVLIHGVTYPNGLAANNVCKITSVGGQFVSETLSTGYFIGPGNGTNGRVLALAMSSVGDVYVGGEFTQAGGFPYSSKIGVYRASGGWNTYYIFSAWSVVSELFFNGNVLTVIGDSDPVWTFGGIENSPIARYIGGFSTNLLRCPSDRFLKLLDQDPRHIDAILVTYQRYRFSYTLNRGRRQTPGGLHYGMASKDLAASSRVGWYTFRVDFIRHPSEKILLAEEATYGESEASENPFLFLSSSSSAWEWVADPAKVDPLTVRHGGRSNATFADGHVAKVRPEVGRRPEHYDPME